MISPLRKLHRRAFVVLSIALPTAFIIGVAGRRPVPTAASLPREFASPERGSVTRSNLKGAAPLETSNRPSATNTLRLIEPRSGK